MILDMVYVEAGNFLLGSQPGDMRDRLDEQPQQLVYLSDYFIQRVPVTVHQWTQFLVSTGYSWDYWDLLKSVCPSNRHPIVYVNWDDCTAFCRWLSESYGEYYTLPTEAQWEKACRGTEGQLYPWCEDCLYPWDEFLEVAKHQEQRLQVGNDILRASPYGCLDMWQNVREWCQDWYDPEGYVHIQNRNPIGRQYHNWNWKVFRGGSPGECPPVAPDPVCHRRGYENPMLRSEIMGFRVVKTG